MKQTGVVVIAVLFFLAGCSSSRPVEVQNEEEDEVQVGYSTLNRDAIVGAVSSADGEELSRAPAGNLAVAIESRFPGVTVIPLNGGFTLRIRGSVSQHGSTEPLIVINGTPVNYMSGGVLYGINPQDIKRIDVLKGAQAAIYGSRGANGVVMITTRRGSD